MISVLPALEYFDKNVLDVFSSHMQMLTKSSIHATEHSDISQNFAHATNPWADLMIIRHLNVG